MTPALLHSQSSRFSLERKSSADALIVVKSLRSSLRKCKCPVELGCAFLIESIAARALDSVRAAT